MKMQPENQNPACRIDEVDRKIIEMLHDNARRMIVDIAENINVSKSTVGNRIERLVEQKILNFTAIINPQAIGYSIVCTGLIRTEPGKLLRTGRRLREISEVLYLAYLSGRFDIIFELALKDIGQLSNFASKKIGNIQGIRSLETFFILDVRRDSYNWNPFSDASNDSGKGGNPYQPEYRNRIDEVEIDSKDRLIIKLLQENGREKNVNIARTVNISESTVKKRIERLLKNRVIEIKATLAPQAFGYRGRFNVGINIKQAQLEDVTEDLLALNEVIYLAHISGRFDIVIEILLRDPEELLLFIDKTIGAIPGIVSTESFFLLGQETQDYSLE